MIRIEKIAPEVWKKTYSELAHQSVFGKQKPSEWDRIDFALLFIDETMDVAAAYITCREYDHETLYWQFGGAFPSSQGTLRSSACFQESLIWCAAKYKRVTFLVENTNFRMLKFAMKENFKIVGVRNFHGSILLEHMLEFETKEKGEI